MAGTYGLSDHKRDEELQQAEPKEREEKEEAIRGKEKTRGGDQRKRVVRGTRYDEFCFTHSLYNTRGVTLGSVGPGCRRNRRWNRCGALV